MANYYGTSGLDIFQGLNSEANYYYFDAGEFNGTDIVSGGTGLNDILWFNDAVSLSTSAFLLKTGIETIHLSGLGNTVRLSDTIVSTSDHTTGLFWVEGASGNDELDASDVQSDGVYMNGSGGQDTLTGGDGDDDLEGGTGDDLFVGSLGDDTYGDYSGDDSVIGTASELDGDTFNQIEWITLTTAGTIRITSFGIGMLFLVNGSNDLTIDAVHSAQMLVNATTARTRSRSTMTARSAHPASTAAAATTRSPAPKAGTSSAVGPASMPCSGRAATTRSTAARAATFSREATATTSTATSNPATSLSSFSPTATTRSKRRSARLP